MIERHEPSRIDRVPVLNAHAIEIIGKEMQFGFEPLHEQKGVMLPWSMAYAGLSRCQTHVPSRRLSLPFPRWRGYC